MSEPTSGEVPLADIVAESRRLLAVAQHEQIVARLLGGVAIAVLAQAPLPQSLRRAYADIDLIVKREDTQRLRALLEMVGYVGNRRFNGLHGARRLLYYDEANGRQLDVFVGTFKMCHELDLNSRLELAPETLTPADLLLTKLQIVEINHKDLSDAVALLHLCPATERQQEGSIDLDRLTDVAVSDWGWYTTLTDNLARIHPIATEMLDIADAALVVQRVETIRAALEQKPKSMAWKMRALIGRRVPWYELPEEVAR